jgi:Ca2+-binding EF-hand superfamily protein
MVKLLEKEINDIKTYFFSIYDKKNRGSIKTDDGENVFLHDALINTLYYLGIKTKEIEINDLIKKYGFNKNGKIYFEDFIEIIKNKLEYIVRKDDIEHYFNILSDGNEYILKSDLDNILKDTDDSENIYQLISEIESKNDKIYYENFLKIFE